MSKRLLILMCSIFLIVPLLFIGCGSGGTGPAGAAGAAGADGTDGTDGATGPAGPGTVSSESCVVCHGAGNDFDVRAMHGMNTNGTLASLGSVTATINTVTFGTPNGDNVPVSVTFTMVATSVNGTAITGNIDLRTTGSSGLSYLNFVIAKLETGQTYATGARDPNTWHGYVLTPGASGSGPFSTRSVSNGGSLVLVSTLAAGQYTYTFPDNAVRVSGAGGGYDNSLTHRVGLQIFSLPAASFMNLGFSTTLPTPFVNATKDVVPAGGTVLTRDVVTTTACLRCHDPLGFHSGGARYDTKYCVVCHNPNIATGAAGWDNASFVKFIHGIHGEKDLVGAGDYSEITFPQSIKNCTTCHAGGTDSDNWKNRPSIEACGSCHTDKTWSVSGITTGITLHSGGAWDNNAFCGSCHAPTGTTSSPKSVTEAHADNTLTPTNVPAVLSSFTYEISGVTMDSTTRRPVVVFRIMKSTAGSTPAAITLNSFTGTTDLEKRTFVVGSSTSSLLTGFTGSPSFYVAFATAQDNVSTPADYNNQGVTGTGTGSAGKTFGQPASVSIAELRTGDGGSITGPDGSGYYTATLAAQVTRNSTTGAITATYNAAYPAGATMKAVALAGYFTQSGVRRPAPSQVRAITGETFVRRTVVDKTKCLTCHEILALHGSNRVNEVQVCVICHNTSNVDRGVFNFKEMIHGIHGGEVRGADHPYTNFSGSADFSEVTYPANPKHCTKCHFGTTVANSTYTATLPDNVLLTTVSGTGFAGTDNVNSPTASACYYCHASNAAASHYVAMGGDIFSTRTGALLSIPWDLSVGP